MIRDAVITRVSRDVGADDGRFTKIAFVELSMTDNVVDWTVLKNQGLSSSRVISIISILIAKIYLFIILIIYAAAT